ncbi:carbohydrate binding protein [Candidatus Moduliflexus flocculans]|uniref:Carbohydrate binding protein n=1 Tax=Candidatus Moduliflexus flocculans TaxID=1499966 RepID=A0A0S6VRT6_9BACT|nr:carbohydrate binding protein [Candidatus Moduliflexus flocculans]
MMYGYFDDKAREYVITTPKTPVKWVNYIGGLAFGGIIDQTGGSLICKGDPALNRIVKYVPQLPSSDFKGETLYIRLKHETSSRLFSPYFVPTLDQYDRFECRVGLGYSRYITEFYGIRSEITVFVPIGEDRMIRDIKITNLTGATVEIDVIPVVEYTHFDALKQFTNADWVPQTMQSKAFREENGLLILQQYAFMKKETAVNYLTSNWPVSSFESDRKRFLGDNEYGTWRAPKALEQAELGNYEALRGDNIGALLHHLGTFTPNETKRIITQLGQTASISSALPAIQRFRSGEQVDAAFTQLADSWNAYLSKFQVNTPDAAMNSMLNVHNPRQCHTTKNWSRDLSLYQLGFGGRGMGFRDSSQDSMGILAHAPDEGKALLTKLLCVQKRDGSAMHQFFPSTMEATVGDSHEMPDRPKYYGDDHLWIILAVTAYLKESGDMAFLDQIIPFYEKDAQKQPLEFATVLEHLHRAISFTQSHKGAHGIPLLGFADWNDTVNLRTGAESLFVAAQFGKALLEMIELMGALGKQDMVATYQSYYDDMKRAVNDHGWDGEWFIRYFDFDGSKLGSKENAHGQIYTNGQSWPVIAGFADKERAEKALNSVNRLLNTKNGIKLSYPGFNGYDPNIGGITTYPPGAKENGGIFLHANPWVMIAETIMGNGDRAFQYYNQINPAAKNDDLDTFEVEPYSYPQNILGDEHPQFGLGRNSWLSGTASWTYQAATKYILGILPTYAGLQVNPCIPKAWDGFTATRVFRGATYQIVVNNPTHVSKGVASLKVDGKTVEGTIIPIAADGATVSVEVTMG